MSMIKLSSGVLLTVAIYGVLLFGPAGTLDWWRAWLFLGVVGTGAAAGTAYLYRINPAVVAERFKPPIQKGQPLIDQIIVLLLITCFIGGMAVIPLDVFRWHLLPKPGIAMSSLGLVLFILGWWIMIMALKENAFAALAVKHLEGQKVIENGVYGMVRHPMYAGAALTVAGMPLWLESYAGVLLAMGTIGTLGGWRIKIEEEFLRRELPGYAAYTERVRYRLIPRVW